MRCYATKKQNVASEFKPRVSYPSPSTYFGIWIVYRGMDQSTDILETQIQLS